MSNFQCEKCGMTNIDCGKDGFKTPRELELEARVKELERKLEIAESTLKDIATFDNYIVAQCDAQEALQKMEEVTNE